MKRLKILIFLVTSLLIYFPVHETKAATFTPGMAKRDAPGPFDSSLVVQGDWDGTSVYDLIRTPTDGWVNRITDGWELYADESQGSIVFWITPEWNGNDNLKHIITAMSWNTGTIHKDTDNRLYFNFGWGDEVSVDVSSWTAGTTYNVVARWDRNNTIDGINHLCLSINNSHTCGRSSMTGMPSGGNFYIGNSEITQNWNNPANAIIEGLTVYRRPLYDGSGGIDVGNGDEIAKIYDNDENNGNGITPTDPTSITGSWDVTLAVPTNSSTGSLNTSGNAWMHPFRNNLLYTSTTNTGGYMMNGTYTSDGWNATGALTPSNGSGSSLGFDGVNDYGYIPYSSATDLSSNFTISFWFKPTETITPETTNYHVLLAKMSLNEPFSNSDQDWGFWIHQGTSGRLRFGTYGEGIETNKSTWNSGTWYHIAIAFTNDTTASIYVNGVEDNYNSDFTAGAVDGAQDNAIYLGRMKASQGEFYGKSNLDDLKIFNRVLTADNIRDTMYKGTLSSEETNGLVGWWKLNEGTGQSLVDSSTTGDNGTLGADNQSGSDDPSWSSDTANPTISSLSNSEKIFAGGYKTSSSGASQGIYYDKTVTAGNDWVIRGIGHSDGTCSPRIILYNQTAGTEIGHLDGTTSSTRLHPDNYIFTGEAPSGMTTLRVKLINTASSGTCYWHQIEMYTNRISNPSFANGSGDPWTPDGWTNNGLDSGDSSQETTVVHSGASSFKVNSNATTNETIQQTISTTNGEYYMFGAWMYESTGNMRISLWSSTSSAPQNLFNSDQWNYNPASSVWAHGKVVRRVTSSSFGDTWQTNRFEVGTQYYDDYYAISLSPFNLSLYPSSLGNSTENTDEIRVDGRDTYVDSSISNLETQSGRVSFNFRPRHSSGDAVKFAESSSDDAYVIALKGDSNDFINVFWDSANVIKMEYSMNGVTGSGTWNASGSILANTEYSAKLTYRGGVNMVLSINEIDRITLTSLPSNFDTAPNTVYYGSDSNGANQGDATFSNISYESVYPTILITPISPDPVTSTLTPAFTGSANSSQGTISKVEYQMETTLGSWSDCVASDGAFDESSEDYICSTNTNIVNGVHTIYVRSKDSYGVYTSPNDYKNDIFTINHNCNQENGKFKQCDWSGGDGQTNWSNTTKYSSSTNITINEKQINLGSTAGWSNRKLITINESMVSGTNNFSDFPVLISITDSDLAADAQDDGDDIMFMTSDGLTKLDHEIESFNGSTGELVTWVNIPTLNAVTNTTLYLYYNNPSATNQQNITGTWNTNYRGVWHLKENPAGISPQILDSTLNNNDGVSEGGMDSGDSVAGKIGKAIDYDGDNARTRIADNNSIEPTSQVTFSAWIKNNAGNCWGKIFSKDYYGSGTWNSPYVSYSLSAGYGCNNTPYMDITTSGVCTKQIATTALQNGTWYYVVGTWDGSVMKIYINGTAENGQTNKTGILDYTYTSDVTMGNRSPYTPGEAINSVVDEMRIVSSALSADWIKTEYYNQNTPASYITFGSEENNNISGSLTSSIFDTGQGSNWGILSYITNGLGSTSVKVRTSNNSDMGGAMDFSGCDVINSNSDISDNNCVDDTNRYIQYQLNLSSANGLSPTFIEISIPYTASDNVAPTIYLTPLSPDPNNNVLPSFVGSVSEDVGTVTLVEFQMDATTGPWNSCMSDDGIFDETSETFTCSINSPLDNGTHTIYLRATDSNGNSTLLGSELSDVFVIDNLEPSAFEILEPGSDSYINNERPTFKWKASSDSTTQLSKYVLIIDNPSAGTGQPTGDFMIDNIPISGTSEYKTTKYISNYENFSDSISFNDYISIFTTSSSDWNTDSNSGENDGKLREGKIDWKVRAVDTVGNTSTTSRTLFVDRTSPNLEITQLDTSQPSSDTISTINRKPTIFGKITDPLSGGDPDVTQDDFGSKIASGPRIVQIEIEKKELLSYELYSSHTITFDKPWWTCDNQEITDNSKQKCDKYLPFQFTPLEDLELGKYRIRLTGFDQANNNSSEYILFLNIKNTLSDEKTLETELIDTNFEYSEDKCVIHTIKEGDTLSSIALKYLGDASKYQDIIDENIDNYPSLKDDPSSIKIGWALKIQCIGEQEDGDSEKTLVKVEIKVVDKDNNPVEGAKVILYSNPKEAITDENGIATFENVEVGEHKAVISYEGYTGEQVLSVKEDNQDVITANFTIQVKKGSPFNEPKVIIVLGILTFALLTAILIIIKKNNPSKI